ncbi:hypothetical protein VHEMI02446 [[Torrubiella] hemipterigena]|uniref:Major facilitator superfamily (MFS) profile domain-containing protein n=1 Tax=[Torrubiella] hemipterigena TaxID=1531966 RepID=A0A0A1T7W5_9HYPO|nr:hypothetical protein VHEMI02446 [[Torrubiella] hemipterigena]
MSTLTAKLLGYQRSKSSSCRFLIPFLVRCSIDTAPDGFFLLAIVHVFGLMMASISTTYYQLMLSQGICSAIGVAAVFMASIACVSGWFDSRRGTAFGILATGSSLGGVVFPILITKLINNVNYGWAMRTAGFLIAAMLTVTNLTVRQHSNIRPRKEFSLGTLKGPFSELRVVCC